MDPDVARAHDEQAARRLPPPCPRRSELGHVRDRVDRQEAGLAHEAGDEAVGRVVEDVEGRADLLDPPGADHGDAIADRQRFRLVVRDEHGGGTGLVEQVHDVGADLRPKVGIETRERLVEQHQPRVRRQRPGERDPLPLAARQLVRVAVAVARQTDRRQPVVGAALALRTAQRPQAEHDVPAHRQVREQRVLLEHETHVALLGVGAARSVLDEPATDSDLAAIGGVEPGDDAQQRRLATPARPDEREQLAVGDVEIDIDQGARRSERLGDAGHLERTARRGDE